MTAAIPTGNLDYWNRRKDDFPFHAEQTEHITAKYARPEQLNTNRHGEFMRIPMGDRVLWAFTTERARDTFLSDFGGTILND